MSYLPIDTYPVWKSELFAGRVHASVAGAVGDLIGQLHAASAGDAKLAEKFATDDNFRQLRIDPFLTSVAARHRDLADPISEIATTTSGTHRVVVHGDVSPKNILVGMHGPVLLDAECAWYGDPAFDIAFMLTHLMLKALVLPHRSDALRACGHSLLDAYTPHVTWEDPGALTGRVGRIWPALLLARVDGLSPVEYLNSNQQPVVRTTARDLLLEPAANLDEASVRIADAFASTEAPATKQPSRERTAGSADLPSSPDFAS